MLRRVPERAATVVLKCAKCAYVCWSLVRTTPLAGTATSPHAGTRLFPRLRPWHALRTLRDLCRALAPPFTTCDIHHTVIEARATEDHDDTP